MSMREWFSTPGLLSASIIEVGTCCEWIYVAEAKAKEWRDHGRAKISTDEAMSDRTRSSAVGKS